MKRTNWRDAPDVFSFYFTRFPKEMCEKDLRYEFKKWGDVREFFIAKNTNRSGKRYGFVRFKGVGDVGRLERQLDNLIIGGLKLHVNIPKHGRERMLNGEPSSEEKYKVGIGSEKIIEGVKDQHRNKVH